MMLGRFTLEIFESRIPDAAIGDPQPAGPVEIVAVDASSTGLDRLVLPGADATAATVETRVAEGDVALVARSSVDGAAVGIFWLCPLVHRDRFCGDYSKPGDGFVYGHQLFVTPAGRGQQLGRFLLDAGRHEAARRWGSGMRDLVATTNAASLRIHRAVGFRSVGFLDGIRVGERTLRRSRARG